MAVSQESQRFVKVIKPAIEVSTIDDIVVAYLKGMSCRRIAHESKGKFTEWQVYTFLRDSDTPLREHGSRGLVDHDFFKMVDTPEKAYLIGLIQADGNVSRGTQLTITQHRDLISYIVRMCKLIKPDASACRDNGNCKRVTIVSKPLVTDLQNIGIVPNKTYAVSQEHADKLWSSIPDQLIPDFLRGMLDGDGGVCFGLQANAKTLKHKVQWLGSKPLMEKIRSWIHTNCAETKATVHHVKGTRCLYRYIVSSPKVVELACREMFKNFKYPYGHPIKASKILNQYSIDSPVHSSVNGMEVILPPSMLKTPGAWNWYNCMENAAMAYSDLLLMGVKPEDARYLLPNATKTEIVVTMNLRMWRHVFRERALNQAAQWEIRGIFRNIFYKFRDVLPCVFGDLTEVIL